MERSPCNGSHDPRKSPVGHAPPARHAQRLIASGQRHYDDGYHYESAIDDKAALLLAQRWRYVASTGNYNHAPHHAAALITALDKLELISGERARRLQGLFSGKHDPWVSTFAEALIVNAKRLLRRDNNELRKPQPLPTRPDARPMGPLDIANVVPLGTPRVAKYPEPRWTVTGKGAAI